jgi:hypothetical protein
MKDLTNPKDVQSLQVSMRLVFDTPAGKEVMDFIEQIGNWTPNVFDSLETNEVIARDSNRRLIGTLKTLLALKLEEIVSLAKQGEE